MNSLDNKKIQIADFFAEKGYLPISKKGTNWWYLSPLHNENTASFKVNVDKNVWYDFGLGKGGIVAYSQSGEGTLAIEASSQCPVIYYIPI